MEKKKLKAVHDNDLEALLRSLELYSDFIHGKLNCAFCTEVITFDNLHSLFPDSGAVKFCCYKPDCVNQLLLNTKLGRG